MPASTYMFAIQFCASLYLYVDGAGATNRAEYRGAISVGRYCQPTEIAREKIANFYITRLHFH